MQPGPSFLNFVYEYREHRGSVVPRYMKERRVLIVVSGRMLQNKPAIAVKQFSFENFFGQVVYCLQCIGRSCKYEIKCFGALANETEHIGSYHPQVGDLKFFSGFFYKGKHFGVFLNDGKISGTPGGQLVANAAGAAKKIQRF